MRFTKVDGAGNDFVLVDAFHREVHDPASLARATCDRRQGIGADGLLLVLPPDQPGAVARLRIFNADGGEALMCGNGLRCVVRLLHESGRLPAGGGTVLTASGPRHGGVDASGEVEVELGTPRVVPTPRPLPADLAEALRADPGAAFFADVGNPHLVVRVADRGLPARARQGDRSLDDGAPDVSASDDRALEDSALEDRAAAELERAGVALGRPADLPQGANVHLLAVTGPCSLRVRPWERGVGATRACGTGAVAAFAVSRALGWITASRATVSMPGGDLRVRWDGRGPAHLSGPARTVFEGEWPEP